MKTTRIILGILLISLCLIACDDFVDVEIPSSQLTGAVVFDDRNTANAALADLYSKLRDSGILTGGATGAPVSLGIYADELTYYGMADENVSHIFNNTLLATNATARQFWNDGYHQIYCANAIIEGCQNAVHLSSEDKTQFIGEATFIRALVHFYLVNLYGDVPFITTTNYEQNRLAGRMPEAQVYESIITDLNEAIEFLPQNYLYQDRVRPNKAAATVLLARVYLYQGLWQQAEAAASNVIGNPDYVWEEDLNKIFLKESPTTIWQFSPRLEGNNTNEASVFIFTSGPPPFVGLNPDLVAGFDDGDLRKTHWVASVTDGGNTWYHAHKYKQNTNTGASLEYSIIFRVAEQYLIRAEARARQGNLSGAREDLNKIRNTAGLPDTPAMTTNDIIDDIIVQCRLELFTEYGHRFFDLKRTGRSDTVLPPAKPGWDPYDNLWPIPETELLANPNMTQNPGY